MLTNIEEGIANNTFIKDSGSKEILRKYKEKLMSNYEKNKSEGSPH